MWVATCGWVYNTKNSGDNWTRYKDGFNNRRVHDVELDPCDRDALYAGTVAGLYRSNDAGKTWYVVSDEDLVVNTIALHPQRPGRIILGIEGDGVYVSEDSGKTFARSCQGLRNLTVTSVAVEPAEKKHVYAAVAFGGVSSGIYESSDAGQSWKKLSTTKLPSVLTLAVADDTEVKFVAGTEKGFFWSNDGSVWLQAEPANAPIRVDRIVRFNRARFFAATSEGVFTSRDSGQSWYRLADSADRSVDIALGNLGEKKALFALTANGLTVFDGEQWQPIAGAPSKGRTLAVRNVNDSEYIFVAGSQGVKAGRIGIDRLWHEAEAPDAQFASVFGTTDAVFLTSRQQHDILVGASREVSWNALPLPSRTAEVTSVAIDPFDANRIYFGTLREGLFVYEGVARPYEAKKPAETIAGAGAGNEQR
jgi:photosystem II stability/assembly factor-like uncharacterized protein